MSTKLRADGKTRSETSKAEVAHYECGSLRFESDDYYDRHLVFDHAISPEEASPRQHFEALAASLRDLLTQRWLLTRRTHDRANPKRVYYLSMEFLIGRTLRNNILNLGVQDLVDGDLHSGGQDWRALAEEEPDAGLGNGGLGRLAACFVDSLATLEIPAVGYGLRYEYGIFKQGIEHGGQVEHPDNWLRRPDPWEVCQPRDSVDVRFDAQVTLDGGSPHLVGHSPVTLRSVPYDRPVVGHGGRTINTLRLWEAGSLDDFDLHDFSRGDFVGAVLDQITAQTITRVLYPNDATAAGRQLRFAQEYFLVASSLADIVRRFRKDNPDWSALPNKVAIQLNDTHPAMAVAELMRILLDEAHLGWDQAWDLTVRTLAYTNHTLLPEALEKWSVDLFTLVLPRHMQIIYEINHRFMKDVAARYPGDDARAERMSLIEEKPEKKVRMANLAIVGTHSTNGVSAIHSRLLREHTVKDLAEFYPERFSNKTNGVTPRRWLAFANPPLAELITEAIGPGWVTDLERLRRLVPLAEDASFRARFRAAHRRAKEAFAGWVGSALGINLDPTWIFDTQVKRIHEYKRQLLNVLHVVALYDRLRREPDLEIQPRVFLIGGKAAAAYATAKLIIKLIVHVAQVVNAHPIVSRRIKLLFLPDYNVSLAERLIPASDVSEQISTAGYEASGTSNMKFMMNGALTVGTRDGATIEIAEEAGEENAFLFGLTADQVLGSRGWYNPRWHYDNEEAVRRVIDLIASDHFSAQEPGTFRPILHLLLEGGDTYRHLADFTAYADAQTKVAKLYADPEAWTRKSVLNVACSGKFSSDRTIADYAAEIWHAKPCPVP